MLLDVEPQILCQTLKSPEIIDDVLRLPKRLFRLAVWSFIWRLMYALMLNFISDFTSRRNVSKSFCNVISLGSIELWIKSPTTPYLELEKFIEYKL